MPSKLKRQIKIKEILGSTIISSHEVLVQLLRAEGFAVTQATLSRDFADLGVIRTKTEMGARYIISPDESGRRIAQLIGLEIISIEHNESLIVIRTISGRAPGVGHYIDRLNQPEIMGTVAGDDTVLVIPSSTKKLQKIVNIIKQIILETK